MPQCRSARWISRSVCILLIAGLMGLPGYVFAEWYGDIYAGAVYTHNTDLNISGSNQPSTTYNDLGVKNNWTAGARVGYWLDQMDWLGFGLDGFIFHLKTPPGQTVTVTSSNSATTSETAYWNLPALGIGFDVLRLRLPLLRDEAFAHGRLQPFVSAGPSLFITYAGQNNFVQPSGQNAGSVSVGPKIDAGLEFMVTKSVGLFAQYRYTHFTSKLNYQDNSTSPASEKSFKSTYDSQQVIGGLSFSF